MNEINPIMNFSAVREHTIHYSYIFPLLLVMVEAIVDLLSFMTMFYTYFSLSA